MKRILVSVGCVLLLLVSWVAAITAQSDAQKQEELIQEAETYLEDEVYILTVPLLEEAAGYEDDHTQEAEELLKTVICILLTRAATVANMKIYLQSKWQERMPHQKFLRKPLNTIWIIQKCQMPLVSCERELLRLEAKC